VGDALFPINAGTNPAELAGDHKDELRVWLGLFSRTAVIERAITIAYDLMAQIEKGREGMSLEALPRRLMVADRITGLIDWLMARGPMLPAGMAKETAYRAVQLQ
jgi:hypothetical protein